MTTEMKNRIFQVCDCDQEYTQSKNNAHYLFSSNYQDKI